MIIKNIKIVTLNEVIDNGYIEIEDSKIKGIHRGECSDKDSIDGMGRIAFPGFIDIHMHGSLGIDFMDATKEEIEQIGKCLYSEGVTSFLATTLTSDIESLKKVALNVKAAKATTLSLAGIHLEGPYISVKYKGAQNEEFIRDPNINELRELQELSDNNVKYITIAPERPGSMEFIDEAVKIGVTVSAGHSDAKFSDVEEAIKHGLTNTTHTHNAMSPHHHRNPGVVTASMYFDELYTEMICDFIHVCKDTVKTFYKIVGPDRFIIVTDALAAKHSNLNTMKLFGLDCIKKDGALYLTTGPLAGSLLTMDKGMRNLKEATNASLIDLMKATSYNASKSIHLNDRGLLEVDRLADIVLMDDNLNVKEVYKLGKKVFSND